jgi:hypothetical protein
MKRPDTQTSFAKCENGAILLMGLFMCVLLVSCLYYLVGIGDTILFREKMQDAADASAYSAAIIHARGMNIIVMINILMAAVLAVLVVLKLISTICIAAIAICVGLAFVTFGASMAPVPFLESGRQLADNAYGALKEPVFQLLRGGNQLAEVVARITPIAAQIEVQNMATTVYAPPAEGAVMFPLFEGLPVEDDDFDVLCGKAGEFAGQLAGLPLKALLRADFLSSLLGSALGGLAKTFASYFCGDGGGGGGGPPPSITYEEPKDHPPLDTPESRACEANHKKEDCDAAAAQGEALAESVNRTTGDCEGAAKADCEARKDRARSVCKPGATPDLESWWWQERRVRRTYKLVQVLNQPPHVERDGEDVVLQAQFIGGKDGVSFPPPCGRMMPDGLWSAWDADVRNPVCVMGQRIPPVAEFINQGKTHISVDFRELTDVISCQSVSEKSLPLNETLGEGGGSDKASQRVKECANLGEAPFQIKVAVKGDIDRIKRFEPGVRLAAWGKNAGDGGALGNFAQQFGSFAFAQAEFYWAGGGGPTAKADYAEWKEEWMWSMQWQARMRRVQLDEDASHCSGDGDIDTSVLPLGDVQSALNDLFVH